MCARFDARIFDDNACCRTARKLMRRSQKLFGSAATTRQNVIPASMLITLSGGRVEATLPAPAEQTHHAQAAKEQR